MLIEFRVCVGGIRARSLCKARWLRMFALNQIVRYFQVIPLTNFDRQNLFWCRHLDIISDLLLSNTDLSAERIMSFSVRQRSHCLERHEYAGAFLKISQRTRKLLPSRLRLHMCFDSSVWFSYLSFLKLIKWFAQRCLNDVSVEPMYTLQKTKRLTLIFIEVEELSSPL